MLDDSPAEITKKLKKEEDALRVNVKPKDHAFTEWLTYTFTDKSATAATLALSWDKLEVPVLIEVDVKHIVLANMRNELRGTPAFTWQGWYDAAAYCQENNFNTEEAIKWIDNADRMKPGDFTILQLKASLLRARGETAAADLIMKNLIATAHEADLNAHAAGKNKGSHRNLSAKCKTSSKIVECI